MRKKLKKITTGQFAAKTDLFSISYQIYITLKNIASKKHLYATKKKKKSANEPGLLQQLVK